MMDRRQPSETQSAKVRDYAIAGSCAVFVFLVAGVVWGAFAHQEPVNVWSECTSDSANVFVGATNGNDLQNVRCVALDGEFFAEPEIVIGDLSKNSEDVCRFKPSTKDANDAPLRFDVLYNNGKVRREVCNWSNFVGRGAD